VWHFKFQEPPQEIEVTAEKVRSTPQGSPAGVRRRLISDFDQAQQAAPSETESSESSTASPSSE